MLQDVISGNLARQRRARELNLRAGDDLFPVLTKAQMEEWLRPLLNGARRAAEIADVSALALPPLDAELEVAVLRDNPDTVTLLGEELKVEYRGSGYVPRVVVRVDDPAVDRRWLDLPEELKLPGGTPLEVEFCDRYGYTVARSQNGAELRAKVLAHLNAERWDRWTDRPEISVNLGDPLAKLPEITQAEYGRCAITNVQLIAYGVVACEMSYYGFRAETKWFHSREEAQANRLRSVEALERHRATERAKAKEAEVRAEAERLERALQNATYRAAGILPSDYVNPIDADARAYRRDLGEIALFVERAPGLLNELEARLTAALELKAAKEAGERAELAPILASDARVSLETAQRIRDFAEACVRLVSGNREAAIRRIAREFRAEYGRARRQEGLRNAFPGLERMEEGREILGFYRAEDLDLFLGGALAWLKSRAEAPSVKKPAAPSPPAATAPRSTSGGLDLSGLGNKFTVRKT